MFKVVIRRVSLFVVLFFGMLPAIVLAQVGVKLTPDAGSDFDYFGESVAIDGDYAIVGSWLHDNANGEDAGAARIYERSGAQWIEQTLLLADDGEAGDQFGISVAINGSFAFVGAHRDDNGNGPLAGSVYVFRRDGFTWSQQARLEAPDGALEDQFGVSLASRGDRLIVGAPGTDQTQGAAYIYHETSGAWLFVNKIQAGDGEQGDAFGKSVDIDAEYAVIGSATRDEEGLADAGAAYVFTFDGSSWVEEARLVSSESVTEGAFGHTVSISGNYVLVGAPRESVGGEEKAGAAYLFLQDGAAWSEQTRLSGFGAAAGDEFGFAVKILGDYAVVGARWHRNNAGAKSGAAYLYSRSGTTWTSEARLQAIDGDVGDQFGNAVGFSNEQVIVGARWDDTDAGKDAGSAYIFPVGDAGVPSLQPSVSELDFGSQSVGEDTDLVFELLNVGTADLNITSLIIEGSGASHFRIVQGGGTVLEPLEGINATIEFAPQSPGSKMATLRVESNEPASPRFIALSGIGVEGVQPGVAKVVASRGSVESFFGSTVAVAGEYAIVGAEGQRTAQSGAAYIFQRIADTWVQQDRISANDAVAGDRFGSAVDISATHAIVGAWNANDERGAAYIFVKNGSTWTQQARLIASDGAAGAQFGQSVSIEGNIAVVGAWQDDNERGSAAGAAYIYAFDGANWQQQAKVVSSDGRQGDRFGSAVTVNGGTVLIGAANGGFFGEGVAYVFSDNGTLWQQDARLVSPSAGLSDGFGLTVAVEGDVAVIGAPLQDNNASIDEGAAYAFVRSANGWGEGVKLTASNGSSGLEFGSAVDIVDAEIVVGARGANNQRGAVYMFSDTGAGWGEDLVLEADDGEDGDGFGGAIAYTGFDIIVGAPENKNINGPNAGAVYPFSRDGSAWNQEVRLLARNGFIQPLFGAAVSIDGNIAVIGAEGAAGDQGAAYVLERNGEGWRQVAALVASDGEAGDRFGASVAVDGDYIAVGAPSDDNDLGADAGAGYIFVRGAESWSEQDKLLAADGAGGDGFGASVGLSGDAAVFGAPGDDNEHGADAGAVYVFGRNGESWIQQARLLTSDGQAGDRAGASVDIESTTLVAGAPGGGLLGSGVVYVFELSGATWSELAGLVASNGEAGDGLGSSVALNDIYIVAGAVKRSNSTGAAYIYRRTSGVWNEDEIAMLQGVEAAAGDEFGYSVDLSGDFALVGARSADGGRGAAYLFERGGSAWLQQIRMTPDDEGGSDGYGVAVGIDGGFAVVGAMNDDNGNGEQAGSAYLVSITGSVTLVSNDERLAAISDAFLGQNYPNPFAGSTTIPFALDSPQRAQLEIFDLLGRRVAILVDGELPAGRHEARFEAGNLSSGVYYYRFLAKNYVETRPLVVIE